LTEPFLWTFGILCVIALVLMVIGTIVKLGYCRFNLDLIDRREPEIRTLFSYFEHWRKAVVAGLLQALTILLWALLLIVPGIMKAYSLAMTSYILAEDPTMGAREAMTRSEVMMQGNRWRLFCLEMSFIGWGLLCVLTLGIGNLWLRPYQYASFAAFYREISGTERIISTTELA
jgi:uncharacterized membrane protein